MMAEKPGDLTETFEAAHSDTSVHVDAQINFPTVALGKIYIYENDPIPPTDTDMLFGMDALEFSKLDDEIQESVQAEFRAKQLPRYEEARKLLINTYEQYLQSVSENMTVEMEGDADKLIEPEVAFAKDEGLAKKIMDQISEHGKSAEAATHIVYQQMIDRMSASEFTKRIAEQMEQQRTVLQRHLHVEKTVATLRDAPEGSVVFCKSVPPAEVMSFIDTETGAPRLAGVICTEGSMKGHAAIMAKSLGIPFARVDPDTLPTIKNGYDCVINGPEKEVIFHPNNAVLDEYRAERDHLADVREELSGRGMKTRGVKTMDGQSIAVMGNFGNSFETGAFRDAHTSGIGLYRTEMADNMRSDGAPEISEELWYKIFKQNLEECSDQDDVPVSAMIRTLDIAGDKAGRHGDKSPEAKKKYEEQVSHRQISALLRLNHDLTEQGHKNKIKIMIPMIESPDQMKRWQDVVDKQAEDLGVKSIKLGCMGEVPALFDKLDTLDVAFMSIGSNDLIHGFLQTDRYHATSSVGYDPTDPSVLSALEKAVDFGQERNVPISICGDMASEPRFGALAVGAGVSRFSTGINSAPVMKEIFRRIDSQEADQIFQRLKHTDSREERERILDHYNETRLGLHADGTIDMGWSKDNRQDFTLNPEAPEDENGVHHD